MVECVLLEVEPVDPVEPVVVLVVPLPDSLVEPLEPVEPVDPELPVVEPVVVVVEPCLGVMRHVDFQTRYWAQEQKVVVHTHQEGCGVENNV